MIAFKNVTHYYSKNTPFETLALKDLCMTIKKGERLAVMGRTGSGKSTLAQLASGLIRPDSGEITVDGIDTKEKKDSHQLQKKVGLVFQYPESQFFMPTVKEEVAFALDNFEIEDPGERLTTNALTSVGLPARIMQRNPFSLSGGEKRLTAIASIIVWNPDYLFLDEPTAGLDARGRKRVLNLLQRLEENGTAIVVITHDTRLVKDNFPRIVVLSGGKTAFDGETRDFFKERELMKKTGIFEPFRILAASS